MTDGRSPNAPYANYSEKNASRSRLALRLLRSVIQSLGWKYRLYLPTVIALSAVFLLPPRFLQYFTESADSLDQLTAGQFLILLAGFGVAVALALWLTTFLTGLLREWLRLRVSLDLRKQSLQAMHQTPLTVFDSAHRGDWMTRLTSDLHNVEEFLSDSIPQQIQSLTLVIGSAILFLTHSGPLALIPCGAAVVLAWLNARVQRRLAPVLTTARELEGEVFQDLMENYEGLRTIRSAGAEASVQTRFGRRLESVRQAGMRIIRSMAALMGVNEFASQLVITAVLTVLAWSLKQGSLTAADVLVYPFFINVFLGNTRTLAASAYDWNRFFVEGGRLAEILHPSGVGKLDECSKTPPVIHDLSVSGLTIGFPNSTPLLNKRDFSFQSGTITAITGPSGCGKSTLLEILAGLRLPLAGGFHTGSRDSFRQLPTEFSAYVEQRPYLFVGSFRENLTLGLTDDLMPSDEILLRHLDDLGLSAMIEARGGLDAILTDRGLNLSEGQRYRLALGRALVSNRSFLLLDEPFAALDPTSLEQVIAVLIEERSRGKTILIATHQLPEILPTDQKIDLEHPSLPRQIPNGIEGASVTFAEHRIDDSTHQQQRRAI